MSGKYLYEPLPAFDEKEFEEFEKHSKMCFEKRKTCGFWKRVYADFSLNGKKFLSHFGDCHNPENKTHNCAFHLCPILSPGNDYGEIDGDII